MTQTLPKVVADFETQLAAAVSIGATTCTLSSAADDDGATLADGVYGFTVDGGSSSKEYIRGTLAASTKTVSGIQSIDRSGDATSGFARAHRVGAVVTITDHVAIRSIINVLDGTTGFDAASPLGYDGAPTISGANQFATKAYADSVGSGAASLYYDRQTVSGTAGETLAARDLVYFKESDQRWWKCDDDTVATVSQVQLGLVVGAASAGNPCQIVVSGKVDGFTGLTPGSKYYASATAGSISTSAGTNAAFVGWADSATSLLFGTGPGLYDPSKAEKDALGGTAGTPSSSNKFVTAYGLTDLGAGQSQTAADATTAFGEADATTKRNKVAQSFVAGADSFYLRGVRLRKAASTGTFTGTVTVSIQADSAGSPSGTALATKTISNNAWRGVTDSSDVYVLFASELAVTPGTTYWIVAEASTADNANCPNLATNSAGGYGSGTLKYRNATDGWVTVTGVDLYFYTLDGLGGRGLKDTAYNTGSLRDALPTVLSKSFDNSALVNVTGNVWVLHHGLGKVPHEIELQVSQGSSSQATYGRSVVSVPTATYQYSSFGYNEASNGWARNVGGAYTLGSTSVLDYFDTGASPSRSVVVESIDENVAVFTMPGPDCCVTVRA